MDAFHRLSRFGSTVKDLASPVWQSAMGHLARGWLWLTAPRGPVDWKGVLAGAGSWLYLRTIASRLIAGVVFVVLAVLAARVGGSLSWFWKASQADRDKVSPFLAPLANVVGTLATLAVGLFLARAALRQARTSTELAKIAAQQAETASLRHEEQTKADFRRRITESFSKAVEQLGNDKPEVRLGGIYSLERISKESPDDYWTVMETLTAFVRERSRRNEADRLEDFEQRISRRAYLLWRDADQPDGRADEFWREAVKEDEAGEPPATDIAAVLTVIKRRSERSREREDANNWFLDLSGAVLRWAYLVVAHLEGANLAGAQLEAANFTGAYLERASLGFAHLEGANLAGAHLEAAYLWHAHLEGADLWHAHLEGADLSDAVGLSEAQLAVADGNTVTRLPEGMPRPAHWPDQDPA
jgi:hypothetical protein